MIDTWFISKGLIMYRDFFSSHFPLTTYFSLPFDVLFKWNTQTGSILSLMISFGTLLLIFKTTRQFLSPFTSGLAMLNYSLLYYYFSTAIQISEEAILGLLITLIFYNISSCLQKDSFTTAKIMLIGFLVGLTEMFGQISTTILITITLFFIFLIIKKTKKAQLPKNISFLVLSILIVPAILSIYFALNNAFLDFYNANTFYYLLYLKLAGQTKDFSSLPWKDILFFYTPLIFSMITFSLAQKNSFLTQERKFILLILGCASVISIPSVIFSVFHPRHFLYALPLLSISLGFSSESILSTRKWLPKFFSGILTVFLLYHLSVGIMPWYIEKIVSPKKYSVANDLYPGDSMYDAVAWIKNNTKDSDKLLLAGDGLFYLKSERLPAVNLTVVQPWYYKPIEKSAAVIKQKRPEYWIIDSNYLKRLESPQGWNSPEINQMIREELIFCYHKIVSFEYWQIWKKQC